MILKSFSKLFAGNVAVQIVTLAFYPILARMYSPAEFGYLGLLTSLSIILSLFVSGQLHMAFPQIEENSVEANSLLKLSLLFTFSGILFITALSLLGTFDFLFEKSSKNHILLIPAFTFAYSLNEISKMWLIYLRKYATSSIFVVSNRLLSNCFKLFSPKLFGLIYSEIISNLVTSTVVIFTSRKNLKLTNPVKVTLRKFSHYPLFYTFGALAQSFQLELPVFMIKELFEAHIVGLYVLANKLTVQSVLLVSTSLILVLANKKKSSKTLGIDTELKNIFKYTSLLALALFAVLYNYGEQIFEIFLGPEWKGIGIISSYLSLLVLPKMMFIPIYAEILRSGRVKMITILRVTQILLAFLLFYILRGQEFIIVLKGYVTFDIFSDIIISAISYYHIKKINV